MTDQRRRASSSVAFQLWGSVLAAVALLSALIALGARDDQHRERARVERDLGRSLQGYVGLLAPELGPRNDTEEVLAQLAADPAVGGAVGQCQEALRPVQAAVEEGYFEVVDAQGAVVCSPLPGHRTSGRPWSGAPSLLTAVRDGRVLTDGPYADPFGEPFALVSAVPLTTPGATLARSLVYVVPTQFAFEPDDELAAQETLAVDTRTGTVLMRSPERAGDVGRRIGDGGLLAARDRPGLTAGTGLDGVRRLYAAATLPGTPYALLVGTDEDEAYAAARSNLERNGVLGGLIALVLASLGLMLQRRVALPARRLREAMEQVGAGADVLAPERGPRELVEVAAAFNAMLVSRRQHESDLAHQALHDPLTGLPNRTSAIRHLAALIAQGRPCAAVFVDLDRFKLVNDSHGHPVGDQVLVALGRSLQERVATGDLVGRFGGDEFVLVVAGVESEAAALGVAERVRQVFSRPLAPEAGVGELFVSGSVGVALHAPGEDAETVLRHADTAMYRAKAAGRNGTALFDAAMREEALRLLRTESDLHRALEREQLVLHVQPVVDLATGEVLGAEALVRWQHPERGLLAPAEFVPVAEESGLIVPVGAWVLREACGWAAAASERLQRPLAIAVNVSARQVAQPSFVSLVSDVLVETGLAPDLLTLEVTETVVVQDPELATASLGELRARGVRVAIDDFGTGWSSLTYLQTLPVDEIKLDRSYVAGVPVDAAATAIVASVIGMARALGLEVTAEGIETEDQREHLRRLGCRKAQGFLLARPMTCAALEDEITRTAGQPD